MGRIVVFSRRTLTEKRRQPETSGMSQQRDLGSCTARMLRTCCLLITSLAVAHAHTVVNNNNQQLAHNHNLTIEEMSSEVGCYVYATRQPRRSSMFSWGPGDDVDVLKEIGATVDKSCIGQCFKTKTHEEKRNTKECSESGSFCTTIYTAGCDTTGRCKGVADGEKTKENDQGLFERDDGKLKTDVFCCSGGLCNGATAQVPNQLLQLFALLLGSVTVLGHQLL